VSNDGKLDLSLFIDILRTLERIGAPYMIIGGFAATMYGITRTTFDIDFVVDLKEPHIRALAEAYPPPRYHTDPEQMRGSAGMGISFNIIAASVAKRPISARSPGIRATATPSDGASACKSDGPTKNRSKPGAHARMTSSMASSWRGMRVGPASTKAISTTCWSFATCRPIRRWP
jgi:hypothetical protein